MKLKSFMRSGYFLILASFFVIFLFALSETITLNNYNERIEAIYKNSINYSSNYWANQFYVVNSELISLIDKNSMTDYNQICEAEKGADISREITGLQQDLTNMSIINNNRFVFFAYIPEKDVMVSSISHIDYFQEKEMEELKEYILSHTVKNSALWYPVTLGNNVYFLHLYTKGGGYGGCYIRCENILQDIMPSETDSNAYILNMDGTLFYGDEIQDTSNSIVYARAIRMINKKICVVIPMHTFINQQSYVLTVIMIALMAALLLIIIIRLYQERTMVRPLLKLCSAMEEFSRGNVSIRLDEGQVKKEVKTLYQSFNHMADQIVHLKINVYENEIEKNRLLNQFLRVQIQPHFYTNILNVIHALAEAHDYKTIQKLCTSLAGYFRYLLSMKEEVLLRDELQCVKWFTEVQSIRYQGNFALNIACSADPDREKIPPLLLQTFIENSIKHNIMIINDLRIDVKITREQGELKIVIQDNGEGFTEEQLIKMKDNQLLEEEGRHIGIDNIRGRLTQLYGSRASIAFVNLERGSMVSVSIPEKEEVSG